MLYVVLCGPCLGWDAFCGWTASLRMNIYLCVWKHCGVSASCFVCGNHCLCWYIILCGKHMMGGTCCFGWLLFWWWKSCSGWKARLVWKAYMPMDIDLCVNMFGWNVYLLCGDRFCVIRYRIWCGNCILGCTNCLGRMGFVAGHIFRCGKRVCVEGALVGETHCLLCAGIYVNVDVFCCVEIVMVLKYVVCGLKCVNCYLLIVIGDLWLLLSFIFMICDLWMAGCWLLWLTNCDYICIYCELLFVNCELLWIVTGDRLLIICALWFVNCELWFVSGDLWTVAGYLLHVISELWIVNCDLRPVHAICYSLFVICCRWIVNCYY